MLLPHYHPVIATLSPLYHHQHYQPYFSRQQEQRTVYKVSQAFKSYDHMPKIYRDIDIAMSIVRLNLAISSQMKKV